MRIEKCYFCQGPIYPGHGIVFVRNDSKMFRFCRTKCHKHFKAKHNPRKVKWTKAYRKSMGKEMTNDSVFEFEKKRNEPLRYNRDLYVQTIKAIKKIDKIKMRRERAFWQSRLKAQKKQQMQSIENELEKNINLVSEKSVKTLLKSKMEVKRKQLEDRLSKQVKENVILNEKKLKLRNNKAAEAENSDAEMDEEN